MATFKLDPLHEVMCSPDLIFSCSGNDVCTTFVTVTIHNKETGEKWQRQFDQVANLRENGDLAPVEEHLRAIAAEYCIEHKRPNLVP